MVIENRVENKIIKSLQDKLKITKRAIDMRVESIRKKRGYDITRRDAALLLASISKIDISKFVKSEKLKEIRNLKENTYEIETKKSKTLEKDRILKLKDITIKSKEPFIPKSLISQSKEMSYFYSGLYILENCLRNLIEVIFKEEEDWWEKRVSPKIQKDVQKIIDNEKYYEEKRDRKLDYAYLDHLKEIIVINWGFFQNILKEKDKGKFRLKIEEINPSRRGIAHSIMLKENDQKRFIYRVEEILKMF